MSDLQMSLACLIKAFDKYAGKDGNAKSLSKCELKELLQSELGGILGQANDKAALDSMFAGLDANGDDQIDFLEFGTFILSIGVLCHDSLIKSK